MTPNITLPPHSIVRGVAYTYEILKVLGQGSFGITYLATTRIKGPLGDVPVTVALKEFFSKELNERLPDGSVRESSSDSMAGKYRRDFRREAQNLSKLKHRHIINVLESFDANGTSYYSMEYIDGGSLDDYIRKSGGVEERDAEGCIRQIAEALSYMHNNRMLHLDLKPKNVMRRSDGTLVLIDFGLSKQYTDDGKAESSTNIGHGTPGYAPTEQSEQGCGRTFAPTIDIYALGATYYKLLTGETPPTASEVLNDGLPEQVLRKKGVADSTISLIKFSMSPRSKDRPQSVRAFLGLLSSKSKDDERTSFPSLKTDKKKVGEHQQKSKVSKEQKRFPKWVIGVIAGVAIAVLWPKNDKPDGGDNPLANSTTAELFEVETEQSVNDFITPPKSEQTQTHAVSSSPTATIGTNNGYEWVDLGLSVKWATMNVGATSPEDYGDYFAWGETSPKSNYDYNSLKYSNDASGYSFSKYVADSNYGTIDNRTQLDLSDDAARQNWGGSWRMPTYNEICELIENCTWTWTTIGGHNGYKVTNKSNSIFLPAAGYKNGLSINNEGSHGDYWSSSLIVGFSYNPYEISFYKRDYSNVVDWFTSGRCRGHSVRPVCP